MEPKPEVLGLLVCVREYIGVYGVELGYIETVTIRTAPPHYAWTVTSNDVPLYVTATSAAPSRQEAIEQLVEATKQAWEPRKPPIIRVRDCIAGATLHVRMLESEIDMDMVVFENGDFFIQLPQSGVARLIVEQPGCKQYTVDLQVPEDREVSTLPIRVKKPSAEIWALHPAEIAVLRKYMAPLSLPAGGIPGFSVTDDEKLPIFNLIRRGVLTKRGNDYYVDERERWLEAMMAVTENRVLTPEDN